MKESKNNPARVRMTNSDGAEAHPVADDVPVWETFGWRVEPASPRGSAPTGNETHNHKDV